MKLICIFLIGFFCIGHSDAQIRNSLAFPLLKASPIVDSLFDSIKQENNGRYYYLNIINSSHDFNFDVYQLKRKYSTILIPTMLSKFFKKIGYFRYKNLTIFVGGDGDPYNLFVIEGQKRKFKFSINDKMNIYYGKNYLFSATYMYKSKMFYKVIPMVK